MKKLFGLLIALTLVLSACSASDISNLRSTEITIQGKVQSIELTKNTPGSHILNVGTDEFFLRSKNENLGQYLGKFIKVQGALSVENNHKVIQIEEIMSPDEVSDLLTSNEEEFNVLGFSVILPQEWHIEENDISTLGEIRKDRTVLAELAKLGTKSQDPTVWMSLRGYSNPDELLKSEELNIYQVSPLNIYLFTNNNAIYHLSLKTTNAEYQKAIITSFQGINTFTELDEKIDEEEKAFPEPTEEPKTTNDSAYTKEAQKKTDDTNENEKLKFIGELRLLENARFNFSMYYPTNWYWQSISPKSDSLYSIIFSSDPDNTSNSILLRLYKKGSAPQVSSEERTSYVTKDDKNYTFILSTSNDEAKGYLNDMKATIVED